MEVTDRLFELRDEKYADFQAKLTPGIPRDAIIGVRVPELRKFAKAYRMEPESELFLETLPHSFYDENMLHGLLVSEIRNFDRCIAAVDAFLPYVDNWAVCDTMSPKVFQKHKLELLEKITAWIASEQTYTCRFGLEMLMRHFLDDSFRPEYLELAASVHREDYYVNMMVSWYFATALAKQWETAVCFLEEKKLDVWIHDKTIQKARESYRICPEQKAYLATLRNQYGSHSLC